MGFYATGDGYVVFKRLLNEDEKEIVCEAMTAFADYEFGWDDRFTTSVRFYDDDKYYEEAVINALHTLEQFGIDRGEIEYRGEDGSLWRFIYCDGKWIEENGHIEYSNLNLDRLVNALITYVNDDLAVTETEYVRDKLLDMCGLTEDDLKKLGLGYLLDEEEN